MHLKSISLKGFKSFPQRTKLEFAPGVSVIVGPNGSGKSNITDAVLWALGEQSPLAVRGQTMKDVIFAGGHGIPGSSRAEVEVVIDNAAGLLGSDFSEISIVRRLDRPGEGEYRLNGARCRLVDVLELLSDSGLGKEMHSVVSQGKVEQIVMSRPRERRLLIEEAAGLGKHRKRRRRAQLKLERTEENLSRALDVEREARSRLRPLKRQAEAAELHERLERQSLEARMALAGEAVRAMRVELAAAESKARAARDRRDEADARLAAVADRREAAENAFAAQGRAREQLQARLFSARSAADRIAMRLDRARDQARAARERGERRRRQLELIDRERADEGAPGNERLTALERDLAELDARREHRLRERLAGLEAERDAAANRQAELERSVEAARAALREAEERVERARAERRRAEGEAEEARARAAAAAGELAALGRALRGAGAPEGAQPLAEAVRARPGYEHALAAVLGPRLSAALVDDVAAGEELLDASGEEGGSALVASRVRARAGGKPPTPGAERLLDQVETDPESASVTERVLADVWVVADIRSVSDEFAGVAVTRAGRVLDAATGELGQAPPAGERLVERLGRRDELRSAAEQAAATEAGARTAGERASAALREADVAREEADVALRRALRERDEAADAVGRADWLLDRRRQDPEGGPDAVRRAEVAAALEAERRLADQAERESAARARAADALRVAVDQDAILTRAAERAARALEGALAAVGTRRDGLSADLDAGAAAGEETAATLRACAHEEAELQGELRQTSDAVTEAEVAAQQVRDVAAESERELGEVATRLGVEPQARSDPLPDHERESLQARVERLRRRREQLGPVNPLAKGEYEEAVAHVEELETQRGDLEGALAELQGLIRETDRRIRESFEETFEAAARNFEEVVAHLFPGGRGSLRLARQEAGPRPVIGGTPAITGDHTAAGGEDEEGEHDEAERRSEMGVEVEVTPAGKATKRLSLLSGGEKSLVALAFMFAVFLARPCPFYILDEVEAALDDVNIDRFLQLVRRYSDRAQFIVVTHQKRTMDAADTLYGVSMGGDGVSRVISRKLAGRPAVEETSPETQAA